MRVTSARRRGGAELTLSVQLPERRTYLISEHFSLPRGQRVTPGLVLPVTVDVTDQRRLRIEWERISGGAERREELRRRIQARGGRQALDEILRHR